MSGAPHVVTVEGVEWVPGPPDCSDHFCLRAHRRRVPWNRDGVRVRVTPDGVRWVWVRRDPTDKSLEGLACSARTYSSAHNAMRAYAKAVKP